MIRVSLHKCTCACAQFIVMKPTDNFWLHFTQGTSSCIDARGSEICHCAVTADSYLHEKSNIRLFIVLNKPPEADTAETDPAIFATVSSQ